MKQLRATGASEEQLLLTYHPTTMSMENALSMAPVAEVTIPNIPTFETLNAANMIILK